MTERTVEKILGVTIAVLVLVALLPTIFSYIANLSGATGVPSWVPTIFQVIVAAGGALLVYRTVK